MKDRFRQFPDSLKSRYKDWKRKSTHLISVAIAAPGIVTGVIESPVQKLESPPPIIIQRETPQVTKNTQTEKAIQMPKESISQEEIEKMIADDIAKTRDLFLQEEKSQEKTRLAYNVDLDREVYKTLMKYKYTYPQSYEKAKQALNSYTEWMLKSHLGERFNVISSSYFLPIRDGEIYSHHVEEPFADMLKRGQQYREQHGSTEIDREKAEVEGFIHVTQPILTRHKAPENTMVISISPRGGNGSIYQHNFFDVFTLVVNTKGEKEVKAQRVSSGLLAKEYVSKIKELNPDYECPEDPSAEFFLRHPFVVTSSDFKSVDDIRDLFYKDHTYRKEDEFQDILNGCRSVRQQYLYHLCANPDDKARQEFLYNATLNAADAIAGKIDEDKNKGIRFIPGRVQIVFNSSDIHRLGHQYVRPVMTGCGESGGVSYNKTIGGNIFERMLARFSPQSVADFARFGKNEYTGENAKNDPNLCRCEKGSGPHFHCEGIIKEGSRKGQECTSAIVVGSKESAGRKCNTCGEGAVC